MAPWRLGAREGSELHARAGDGRRMMPASLTQVVGWRVWVEERPASEQMEQDVRLAADARPAVRLFLWPEPAMSLGWKQARPSWLRDAQGVEVVERPTAGGAAFHGGDVSCAAVVPLRSGLRSREAMAAVCEALARGCRMWAPAALAVTEAPANGRVSVCLAESSPYGVYVGTRKVAGLALRRFPEAWLIQGSCLVGELPAALARAVPEAVRQDLTRRATSLSSAAGQALRPREVADAWAIRWGAWMDDVVPLDRPGGF